MLSFNVQESQFSDNYKFIIGSILPRPIAVVSTKNEDGTNNVAPFSFFTGVSAKPMIVAFCPLIRTSTGMKKDTLINIERDKEFVINFVTEQNADLVNSTSAELDYGQDEFEHSGLTPIASEVIGPMRVKESPIHFECRLKDIISYGDTPGAGTLVTGEVVRVHIDESLYENGRINTKLFAPMGRGAGNDWFKCDSVVEKTRLMKAQIQK
ncbi:MAG: flavin reductase family protein [Bacteriovoracaceae bacterium]|jgi:flavin reductase (DIM6/NTAB) family NADH-FMN oxidoreductase RutF|nr:flavin reductase family protein [Bacteriovoracaceae bacterium]